MRHWYVEADADGTVLSFGTVPDDETFEAAIAPHPRFIEVTPEVYAKVLLGGKYDYHTRRVSKPKQPVVSYREAREVAYPPLAELADALVHQAAGDSQPLQDYIAKCAAVKKKFPKSKALSK